MAEMLGILRIRPTVSATAKAPTAYSQCVNNCKLGPVADVTMCLQNCMQYSEYNYVAQPVYDNQGRHALAGKFIGGLYSPNASTVDKYNEYGGATAGFKAAAGAAGMLTAHASALMDANDIGVVKDEGPVYGPPVDSGLPSWLLPVGLAAGAAALYFFMKKKK